MSVMFGYPGVQFNSMQNLCSPLYAHVHMRMAFVRQRCACVCVVYAYDVCMCAYGVCVFM